MPELKFMKDNPEKEMAACCGPAQSTLQLPDTVSCCNTGVPVRGKDQPSWVTGTLMTDVGAIFVVSTGLAAADFWEHVKCRISAFRNNYRVDPGLYAVGTPDKNSDVFATANYKLSFDVLRKSLKGLNAWVLVLDTKGINVWCAAGKGTFGSDELIRILSMTKLDRLVDHRRIIVPQLGAPGVSVDKVKKAAGFEVCYGPVRAEDIGDYIASEYRATRQMRTVTFPILERLILTPMEISPAMKKYYLPYAVVMFAFFGLQPGGLVFKDAAGGGLPFLLLGLISLLAGALFTPVLLPYIPFRSFAVKGWVIGMLSVFLSTKYIAMLGHLDTVLLIFTYLFFPLASSYIALQFTGATTFTGMSGVKKELRVSIPLYILGFVLSLVLLLVHKYGEWIVL